MEPNTPNEKPGIFGLTGTPKAVVSLLIIVASIAMIIEGVMTMTGTH